MAKYFTCSIDRAIVSVGCQDSCHLSYVAEAFDLMVSSASLETDSCSILSMNCVEPPHIGGTVVHFQVEGEGPMHNHNETVSRCIQDRVEAEAA